MVIVIRSIIHRSIKGYFLQGKALPASLQKHEGGLRYWLSVLHAATCAQDLNLSGASLMRSNPGYRYQVEGVGEFTFLLNDGNVEKLNFKPW